MKKKFGEGAIRYFTSRIFESIISALRGLILPNILGPFHYGVVSTLNIIEKYSPFTNFGIHQNILYKTPNHKLERNFEELEKLKNNCFYFTLIMGVVSIAAILGITIFYSNKLNTHIFWGLVIMSFYPLLLSLKGVYMISLRTDKKFNTIATIITITTLLIFGLVVVLGIFFKSLGVLLGQVIAIFISLFILNKYTGYKFRFKIQLRKIIEYLKFSIPIIFVIEVLLTFLITIDRIMILKHLGVLFVGYYTIGLSLSNLTSILPKSIATFASPTLVEEYGKPDGNSPYLFSTMTYFIAIIVAFLIAAVSLLAPVIIKIIFAKFEFGIKSAQIIPFALYFEGIAVLAGYALIAMNKTKKYIISLVIISLFAYISFELFLPGKSLVIAALLTVIIYAIKNLTLLILSSFSTFKDFRFTAKFIGTLLILILFTVLICFLINHLFPSYELLNTPDLIKFSFLKILILSLVFCPILIYYSSRTKSIKSFYIDFFNTIKQKLR